MQGFRHKTDLPWSHWSSCSEIAHHQPSVVVFGLGIEGNDLRSYLHRRQGVVIAACDFCAKRVDSEPTPIGVTDQKL